MVKLTFYGGVNEIGGNKILLEDKKTRILLDFGEPFNFGTDYFAGYLSPRGVNGIGDLFEFNLLPRIEGLYAKEMLLHTDLAYTEPRIDAVFLSHAHFDHVNHIQFVDPKIPVHLGEGTYLFLKAMEETSSCNYGEHEWRKFRTARKIKQLENLEITPIHVDHSIPAAYGFFIHTSKGDIVYTGDLRMHGTRKDLTDDFVEHAKNCEPVALICEGTRMVETEKRKNYSEGQVEQLANQIVSGTDKIVFTARYSRDTDRFRSFYNIALDNGRSLVISPKTAHLLSQLLEDKHLSLPDPLKDPNIRVYYKRKKSGKFDDTDYYVWERKFMNKKITHEEVHKNQKHLIMDLEFTQFTELIDIKPDAGSHFIHSMSEPFSEEDIEDKVMRNWIKHFNMHFYQLHASGHINKDQLVDMIDYIKPKKLFPVHTENQQLFKKYCKNSCILEYAKEYPL
jgi:ribonuclease J